jgi:FkbM family methyltransferase
MPYFSIFELLPGPPSEISIVDVGAMPDSGGDRYERLLASGRARVIGFEPQADQLERLRREAGDARAYFPYFLGDGKPGTFHRCRYPGCSSLFRPDPGVIDRFSGIDASLPEGNFTVIGTEQVETTRLDDVPELEGCDFLLVDTQGSELDVLRGGVRALERTAVVEMEVEFVPLYEGQPLFAEIDLFMRERGFLLHKLIDISGRPFRPFADSNPAMPMSQLLWADAVYVKDFTRFGDLDSSLLLKVVAILHETYASVDLAGAALRAYDTREGASLWESYIERVVADMKNFNFQFINVKNWI